MTEIFSISQRGHVKKPTHFTSGSRQTMCYSFKSQLDSPYDTITRASLSKYVINVGTLHAIDVYRCLTQLVCYNNTII